MWVDDYIKEGLDVNPKGIFISNQFRLNKFPDSMAQRKLFEPNEIEYAKSRKICIIPSYVLFEAVNKILAGQSPVRPKIEQLILDTDGVLESIL